MTIAWKLRLAWMVSLLLVAVASVAMILVFGTRRIQLNENQLGFFIHHITERDREALANEIFEKRDQAIEMRIRRLALIPGVAGVGVFDLRGRLIKQAGDSKEEEDLSGAELPPGVEYAMDRTTWRGVPALRFTKPLNAIGERLGFIRIHYSLKEISQAIFLEYFWMAVLFIVIPAAMFLFLYFFYKSTIMLPLASLQEAMRSVNQSGPGALARVFRNDEIGRLAGTFNAMSAGLEESYKKIKLLIHDIHHRVKNNLTVIHSLMSLERQRIDPSDPRAAWKYQDAFESLSVRILVISSIYSQLYGSNDSIETVDCKDFLERLIEKVSSLHNSKNISVSFKLSIESLPVSLNTMIPLALIINEIVSNSFKHAFPERSQGGITLELAKRDGRLRLRISDDGAGLREDFSALKEKSLGMQLIDLLSSQIKADMTVNGADGTSYTFIIGDGNGADTDSRG